MQTWRDKVKLSLCLMYITYASRWGQMVRFNPCSFQELRWAFRHSSICLPLARELTQQTNAPQVLCIVVPWYVYAIYPATSPCRLPQFARTFLQPQPRLHNFTNEQCLCASLEIDPTRRARTLWTLVHKIYVDSVTQIWIANCGQSCIEITQSLKLQASLQNPSTQNRAVHHRITRNITSCCLPSLFQAFSKKILPCNKRREKKLGWLRMIGCCTESQWLPCIVPLDLQACSSHNASSFLPPNFFPLSQAPVTWVGLLYNQSLHPAEECASGRVYMESVALYACVRDVSWRILTLDEAQGWLIRYCSMSVTLHTSANTQRLLFLLYTIRGRAI